MNKNDTLYYHFQVAFASDFASEWKDQFPRLSTHVEHDIDSLVGDAFKGIQISIRDPLYKVSHCMIDTQCIPVCSCYVVHCMVCSIYATDGKINASVSFYFVEEGKAI